jgi:drug/metabolite transporter superfamily protein YnfA
MFLSWQFNKRVTVHTIFTLLIFYKKLVIPSLLFSIVMGFLDYTMPGHYSWRAFGIAYILMSLMFQYFIYEKRNPDEYYF